MGRIRVLAVFAAFAIAACGGNTSSGGTTPSKPDKVQIAAEGPFTGDQASIAFGALQAIQLAVKDFNAKGGVHGTQVQLVSWDDQHNPQTGGTLQAQGISDPTVLGVIGPMNSGVVLGTAQGLQGANPPLPFISESASNTKVTDSSWSVAHRVNARDDAQGPADAKFMIDQGAKKIYLLDAKSDYSTALTDAVQTYLKDKAPNIATQRDSAQQGQKDFSTIVQKVKSFAPDWVFFADEGPEAGPLVSQLKQAGLTIGQNLQFLGTDGEEDASLIQKSQGAYVGAYATNIVPDPAGLPTATSFVNAFKQEYGADAIGKAGPFYGSAYEATQILLQAINKAPVSNGKISRADVISQLASGTFDTIYGSIKFNSKGDVASGGIYVYKASSDSMVVVKQVTG